jgi:hypothetical protein
MCKFHYWPSRISTRSAFYVSFPNSPDAEENKIGKEKEKNLRKKET